MWNEEEAQDIASRTLQQPEHLCYSNDIESIFASESNALPLGGRSTHAGINAVQIASLAITSTLHGSYQGAYGELHMPW